MPYYDYVCIVCGFAAVKKVPHEDCNSMICPNCENTLQIIIHPVPFTFKEKP